MVANIIDRLKLNEWRQINLKSFNDCYIIAIKEKSNKKDTIDVDSIYSIRFELGIDCGIKNKPLTIQHFNVNFNDTTSSDPELNAITAFSRLINIPSEFYIRAISVDDGKREIKSGETSISINVNAVNLD